MCLHSSREHGREEGDGATDALMLWSTVLRQDLYISVHLRLGSIFFPDGVPTTQYPYDDGQKGDRVQARKNK